MEYRLRVEIHFFRETPRAVGEKVLRTDPLIRRALASAMRRPAPDKDQLWFALPRIDEGLLREFLKRIWAYDYMRDVFGKTVIPEHVFSDFELNSAEYLMMREIEWLGEFGKSFGTLYDQSRFCMHCGAGALVSERLICPPRMAQRIENGFGKFSDNEVTVTENVAKLLAKAGVEGYTLLPVFAPKKKGGGRVDGVFHIRFERECGAIPKHNLVNPGERCPKYTREAPHRPGFWLLSPLHLRRDQVSGELFVTRDHFRQYMGDILPGPVIVVSQKVYRMLKNVGVQGVTFEPVTLLDEPDDGLACGHEFENMEEQAAHMDLVV